MGKSSSKFMWIALLEHWRGPRLYRTKLEDRLTHGGILPPNDLPRTTERDGSKVEPPQIASTLSAFSEARQNRVLSDYPKK